MHSGRGLRIWHWIGASIGTMPLPSRRIRLTHEDVEKQSPEQAKETPLQSGTRALEVMFRHDQRPLGPVLEQGPCLVLSLQILHQRRFARASLSFTPEYPQPDLSQLASGVLTSFRDQANAPAGLF